jgi:hypothetical protein
VTCRCGMCDGPNVFTTPEEVLELDNYTTKQEMIEDIKAYEEKVKKYPKFSKLFQDRIFELEEKLLNGI